MDKTTLVDKDLRIGNDIIGLLTAGGMPVSGAFWAYAPQIDEWRLIIASPKVKTAGTRNAYLIMSNLLQKSPLLNDIPLRRISLVSPDDELVKRLAALEKRTYEGALHVVQYFDPNRPSTYHVTFAPYKGPGGAIPAVAFEGMSDLEAFLHLQIGIKESFVQEALRELDLRGSYSFPNVQLTTAQLRRLRLLPARRAE